MSLRSFFQKEKKIPRIVSNIINDGVVVARGCSEGLVSINESDEGFSSPEAPGSTAADFLSLLDRLFGFRLLVRRVACVGVESGGVRGRKGAVIAVGR